MLNKIGKELNRAHKYNNNLKAKDEKVKWKKKKNTKNAQREYVAENYIAGEVQYWKEDKFIRGNK